MAGGDDMSVRRQAAKEPSKQTRLEHVLRVGHQHAMSKTGVFGGTFSYSYNVDAAPALQVSADLALQAASYPDIGAPETPEVIWNMWKMSSMVPDNRASAASEDPWITWRGYPKFSTEEYNRQLMRRYAQRLGSLSRSNPIPELAALDAARLLVLRGNAKQHWNQQQALEVMYAYKDQPTELSLMIKVYFPFEDMLRVKRDYARRVNSPYAPTDKLGILRLQNVLEKAWWKDILFQLEDYDKGNNRQNDTDDLMRDWYHELTRA
jgi:hypothetical protein